MIILIIAWILFTWWSESFSPSLPYLHERAGHGSQGIGGGWQQGSSECHSLQESPPGPGFRVSPSWTHSTLSRPLFLPSHLAVTTDVHWASRISLCGVHFDQLSVLCIVALFSNAGSRTILSTPPNPRRLWRCMRLSSSCNVAITNAIIIIIIAGMRLLWYANRGMFKGLFHNWKNQSRACVGFHLEWEWPQRKHVSSHTTGWHFWWVQLETAYMDRFQFHPLSSPPILSSPATSASPSSPIISNHKFYN